MGYRVTATNNMATLTNDLSHSATLANDAKSSRTLGSFTFDEIGSRVADSFDPLTFDSTYEKVTNDALHTATLSNDAIH